MSKVYKVQTICLKKSKIKTFYCKMHNIFVVPIWSHIAIYGSEIADCHAKKFSVDAFQKNTVLYQTLE